MNLDNISTSIAAACEPVLQPYQAPRLTMFGSVTRLTETGSMSSQEDFLENMSCDMIFGTLNMTGNMC